MSSVIISGDTSGTVTVTVPAVAGTNTITLPAATGTMMVSGNMPAFSAYSSAGQALTGGTFTKIQCNTEEFDTNSNYDNALYRFTPTVAGYYQVNGAIQYVSFTNSFIAAIYKNGAIAKRGVYTSGSFGSIVSVLIYFNGTTDYVELYGFVGTGITIDSGAEKTYFQASMIRGA